MSTSTGNLGLIPRYDPASANQVKTSSTNIGSTAEEIQNNFMKMLVAQMQNQNPLNPMDNAQLAAASTVDWDGQSPVNFGVNSDSMLSNAKLRITTYDGRIVDEVELGGVGPEIKSLSWDGNTKEGPAALSGKYRILVEGLTFDGKTGLQVHDRPISLRGLWSDFVFIFW
ncbi:MAG: hypothetical protein EBV49_05765 [Betaproteobacteria bacterium]|nr:hypothetical protein [Betaproteobacteria bacterium]